MHLHKIKSHHHKSITAPQPHKHLTHQKLHIFGGDFYMTKKRDENIHKEDNKSEKRGEVVRIGEKEREMRENQTQRERERE